MATTESVDTATSRRRAFRYSNTVLARAAVDMLMLTVRGSGVQLEDVLQRQIQLLHVWHMLAIQYNIVT